MAQLSVRERALIHLYQWRRRQTGPELSDALTQEGISDALDVNRAHITRIIRPLIEDGSVEVRKGRVSGKERKLTCYVLTPAGLGKSKAILEAMGDEPIEVAEGRDRRRTNVRTLLQERKDIGELLIADAAGGSLRIAGKTPRIIVSNVSPSSIEFYGREREITEAAAFLSGGETILAVYANHGYGSSAFLRRMGLELCEWPLFWHDLAVDGTEDGVQTGLDRFWTALGRDPESGPGADSCLLCFDNYREVGDGIVDLLIALSSRIRGSGAKMAVAMRGDTPAYDRFYQRADVKEGRIKEIQLGRFDVATARQFLGADLDQEAFQLVYMLTRGQPLALAMVKAGDDAGLRLLRPNEEVRFLMYLRSRRASQAPNGG
jgi:DNA-binding MarR family transcriptional regulator